jgi:hypothetical protein
MQRPDVGPRNKARRDALTVELREHILTFCGLSPRPKWKVLEEKLGVHHTTLIRLRRDIGLAVKTKKALGEGRP